MGDHGRRSARLSIGVVTAPVIFVVAPTVLVKLYAASSVRRGLEPAYIKSCWVPGLLLASTYVVRIPIMDRLSYAAALVLLLAPLASLIWTVIGFVLLASARERGSRLVPLRLAPIVASAPLHVIVVLTLDIWAS